jgi:glycosyltransferase involved in cell wall biosynthesis
VDGDRRAPVSKFWFDAARPQLRRRPHAAGNDEGSEHELPTILFVATPAALGGSNRSLATLLSSLEGRVHRVLAAPAHGRMREHVAHGDLADEYIGLTKRATLRFERFDRVYRVLAGATIAWWAVRNRRRLRAIHANALTGLNLAAPAAILTRRRVVAWVHDPVGSRWGNWLGPIIRTLIPDLQIAAVSPTAEDVAVENGLCRAGGAVIVPNPIDPADVVASSRLPEGSSLHIGFVGGATHRKGFDLLPRIVDLLVDLPLTWKFYISLIPNPESAGTLEQLKAFPKDVVDLAGKTSDVRNLYGSLDIVFCPSREESFCRVAAEAMINGIPVVGSDIPPIRRLLGEGEAGILFPVGDVAAASAAIRSIATDPDMRRRLGDEGRRRAAEFPPEAIAEKFLELYGLSGGGYQLGK